MKLGERNAYSSIAAQETVRQWETNIEVDCFENTHLHLDKISTSIGIITYVQEIINTWRATFLLAQKS
jgi:hypothetical protein